MDIMLQLSCWLLTSSEHTEFCLRKTAGHARTAVVCAWLYLFSICFCEARTCAEAWRIFMRSSCISFTVWSSIFSGSSTPLTAICVVTPSACQQACECAASRSRSLQIMCGCFLQSTQCSSSSNQSTRRKLRRTTVKPLAHLSRLRMTVRHG